LLMCSMLFRQKFPGEDAAEIGYDLFSMTSESSLRDSAEA